MAFDSDVILILRPLNRFGIVTAELKRVASFGRYMTVEGKVRQAHELTTLCEELTADSLYAHYANKKMFRHAEDFWATTEATVKQYVKRMADMRLVKAVRLGASLDIPILYALTEKSPLHIDDRLKFDDEQEVRPVMNFRRHSDGTTYQLQLRIGDSLVERLSEHRLIVLAHEPGMFALDGQLYTMGEGFSAQLLLPFVQKPQVEIPRKLENDYFHRFILKHVTRAEVNAEGFDITDISVKPQPCLIVETAIDGSRMLSLQFKYDNTAYLLGSKNNGRVTLTEENGSFRFIRQLRDKRMEQEQTEMLRQTVPQMTDLGEIRFPSLDEMIGWLRQHAAVLKSQGFDVVQPSDHIYHIGPLDVEQSDTWQGDWLQTKVTVVLDGGRLTIPFLDLRDSILRGEREYMLPTGDFLLIPEEWVQRYTDLLLIGLPKERAFLRHKSQVSEELRVKSEEFPTGVTSAEGLAAAARTCSLCLQRNSSLLTFHSSRFTLRPYQQEGFRWLWQNFLAQTGCCLSDEMGLGKTIQTIALLLKYKEMAKAAVPRRQPQPGLLFSDEEMKGESDGGTAAPHASAFTFQYKTSLVVAPASVVHNWRNELARFAPSLLVMTYTGDTSKRQDKRHALMRWDVVLTTYRTLLNDIDFLARHQFGIVIFDESQAFKTPTSQIHHAVSQLSALHRMALSGTPVENNLSELWSLMNVLNPNLLGNAPSFQKVFVHPIAQQMEEGRSDLLRRLIAPYFLKRTKDEVLSDLPERQDEVVVCPMTDEQAKLYAEELSRARNEWLSGQAGFESPSHQTSIHVLAAIQRLRQIANGEGKLSVVFEHLENLRQTRHKVLLFSEYVTLLECVGAEMRHRGWQYDLLTGQTLQREQVIEHFQREADCQFFLISLKAGGVGLNLTAADYVFLLDPWWNQAAEEQAIARAHRIGQHHPVFVYRFVSANTLEEQILTLQERKQSLIDSVMPFICK